MSYKQMTGNIISATKVEPVGTSEAGAASGVWNLDDQYDYKRGANWPEAGVANPDTLIESNFSTFLYVGSESSPGAIVNGIDLANKGGLVWIGQRDDTRGNHFFDTERGVNKHILSDTTAAEVTDDDELTSFTSTGFVLGGDSGINANNGNFVSWTFKKAPKFFDIVTYEGNGSAGRTLSHSLGSVPGMIMIKNLDATQNWMVYHRKMNGGTNPEQYVLNLNLNAAQQDDDQFHDTAPTNAVFTLGSNGEVNANGENYVAYLFAHETGAASMIQCGSYTGNANNTGPDIDLGWEPQWVLIKRSSAAGTEWVIADMMRGMQVGSSASVLFANINNAESTGVGRIQPTATGFSIRQTTGSDLNTNNATYIYMAIRRPNMATITDATEVFAIDTMGGTSPTPPTYNSGFPVDFAMQKGTHGTAGYANTRLLSGTQLVLDTTAAESASSSSVFDYMDGWRSYDDTDTRWYSWMWKRAKGYFDAVAYTGNATNPQDVNHSLGVVPEMVWHKKRSATSEWKIWHKDAQAGGDEEDGLQFDDETPYADAFYTVDITGNSGYIRMGNTGSNFNGNGITYIMYLFSTLAGVSKVGSVTHSGSSTDVDCGFSAGARFVLIKRIDDTGDWYIWDSVRGIIAGNDPYLFLNTTAATVTNTDLIDPLASGFQISGDFTDGDYVFYAIA